MSKVDFICVKIVNKKYPDIQYDLSIQKQQINIKSLKSQIKTVVKDQQLKDNNCFFKTKIWIKKWNQQNLILINKSIYKENINTQDIQEIIYKLKYEEINISNTQTQEQIQQLSWQVDEIRSQLQKICLENTKQQKQSADILILFSNPLVQITPGQVQNIKEIKGVDYISEIHSIINKIAKLNKKIKIDIQSLTLENFEKYLKSDVPIIHIICHGVFVEEKYFLEFEKEDSSQLLIGQQQLSSIYKNIKMKKLNKKLLFINACYSEQLAQYFQGFEFESMITIQKDAKIKDVVSEEFSSIFYEKLFSGNSVKEAFDQTLTQVIINSQENPQKYHSCCCAHSHTKDCAMIQFMRDNNLVDFHEFHTPTEICLCSKKHEQIHQKNCKWKRLFLLQCSVQYEVLDDQTVFVCCCQKNIQHTEQLKFKLEQIEDLQESIYDYQQGDLIIDNKYINLYKRFNIESNYINLNQKAFQLRKFMQQNTSNNIIFVQGKQGVGKTTFAIYFSLICQIKGLIKEFIYIDAYDIKEDLQSYIKTLIASISQNQEKYFFIIDNIKKSNLEIQQFFNILNKYKDILFLLIVKEYDDSQDINKIINNQISIEINLLSQTQASQLFYFKQQFKQQFQSQYSLINNKVFIEILERIDLSPMNILKLAQLSINENLENLLSKFQTTNK